MAVTVRDALCFGDFAYLSPVLDAPHFIKCSPSPCKRRHDLVPCAVCHCSYAHTPVFSHANKNV